MHNHPSAHEHSAFVTQAVADLLATDTILAVTHRPKVVLPLGVAVQPSKRRLIWDGRWVNDKAIIPTFKYETLAHVHLWAELGDFAFTTDLKSGYHHVDMHPDSWEYLGFQWEDRYYVFTQLPFGLAPACWAFTKITRSVLRWFRTRGVRCMGYIDDALWLHQQQSHLLQEQAHVLGVFHALGLRVNMDKSQLACGQSVTYLGMVLDFAAGKTTVPVAKREALLHGLLALRNTARRSHVKCLASVKGRIISMTWAFGRAALLFTRAMDLDIAAAPSWTSHIRLSAECRGEVDFWIACLDQFDGRHPIWTPTTVTTLIHTDSSGAAPNSCGAWAAWSESVPTTPGEVIARGNWSPSHRSWSSTALELLAIQYGLASFNRDGGLGGTTVQINTDCQNAYFALMRGGAHETKCLAIAKDIILYTMAHHIVLLVVWIPREHNTRADELTRLEDRQDWMLNPTVFQVIHSQWGPFDTDLFASYCNHQLPRYFSRFHTPDCTGVNAFAFKWGRACWANPPFDRMTDVLDHARGCRSRLALVIPIWPSQPWWRKLILAPGTFAMCVQGYMPLPRVNNLFLSGTTGNREATGVPAWDCACLLLDFADNAQVLHLPAPI
jgi:hypothetical protein